MKRIILLFSLLFVLGISFSQVTMESGSQFIVSAGSTVVADNGIVNNGGTIDIALGAFLDIQGDIENNTSALFEATSEGTIRFNGTTAQEITGDTDAEFYGIVEIDNPLGVSFTSTETDAEQTIHGTLTFTNGLLTLNDVDLTLVNDVTTAGSGMYIQTNSAGTVKREVPNDETPVLFPVGKSAYNPVTLQNGTGGVTDTYRVRVVDAEPASSSTPHFVDRSWIVNEKNPGGSELTVTPQWVGTEELTPFDETNSSVGLTTDNGLNYQWGQTTAATDLGDDTFTQTGSTYTSIGTFAVGDYFYSGKTLNLKFFLAGAYNGTDMSKTLNTDGLIPLEDPDGVSPDATSIPTDAVDWVTVQLRNDDVDYTLNTEFSAFVDKDGNLLDKDGSLGANITGTPLTNYYVSVLHRNHFGVMSASPIDLSGTPVYDFSTAQAQAWQDGTISTNEAMKDVGGVFCLWDGNAKKDNILRYNGTDNDRSEILNFLPNEGSTISGYADTDLNMDGITRYNGTDNDRSVLLNNLPNEGITFTEHLPQ